MRTLFTTVLLTVSVIVFGQKKSLLGKYTHSAPYYTYNLILADSGKFTIELDSDVSLKTTTGTWTIKNRLITLTASKCILDISNPEDPDQKAEIPLSSDDIQSFISVDKKGNLTKLAPKKKPDWWADSIKYDWPDYKLTKVLK
jgi:hypothetical protein